MRIAIALLIAATIGSGALRGAVAATEAGRARRLLPAWISPQRLILCAKRGRPGRRAEAAERHVSIRLVVVGEFLLAVRAAMIAA